MVVDHNDISDSHTCSYALTDHHTGAISDFGVVSDRDSTEFKDSGGQVLRKALQPLVHETDPDVTIYNHSDYIPQLEISRFPEEIRNKVYEEKQFEVKESASGTSSHTGEFLVKSAIDFISTNYSRFESPVSTVKSPKPQSSVNGTTNNRVSEHKYNCQFNESNEYYLYTDASFHPGKVETGISFVIIGKNGGLYAKGQTTKPQVIARAELLAFLKGLLTIQTQTKRNCKIIAHTDSEDVKRSVEDGLVIDKGLSNKIEEIVNKDNFELDVRCIDRDANSFPDALAKVGRTQGKIQIGELNKPIQ